MNATPSLDFDVMSATDKFGGPFTPPGFYYKTFIRPRRLWPLYEKVLRHAAGLGKLRKSQPEREWRTEYRRRHADLLVVGGGAAGLYAAIAAAELGADVVLCDEGAEPGGRLLAEDGHAHARELTARAQEAGVEVLSNAPALGAFDGLVPVWQGDTLHQVRARRLLFATGTIEQPLLFAGNDLPGVMISGGARRLAGLYAVKPGSRAVVATVCDRGLEAALALLDHGVDIVAVADLRTNGSSPAFKALERRGVRIKRGATVLEARGRGHLSQAVLGAPGADGGAEIDCDLLVVSGGSAPATSLLAQSGAKTSYNSERGVFALSHVPAGLHAAGEVCGPVSLEDAELSGRVSGEEAAHALGFGDADSFARAQEGRAQIESAWKRPSEVAVPAPVSGKDQGQVLRLPVRGRHGQGHPPERGGGLRLDRALQALHHHHHGALPGPDVPAHGHPPDGPGDRPDPRAGGRHHRPPSLAPGAHGRARREALRARQALLDPRAPARAGRQRAVGRRLAPRLRLRRREGRGARGEPGGRDHRRVHAGQADRARLRGGRAARPPLPQPLLEHGARPRPLRRDGQRRGPDHGRRHGVPPRRGVVLRHHHLERRRRRLRLVLVVAGRLAPRRSPHRRDPGPRRGQSRRPARTRDHGQAHRPRLLERGLQVPRRQARRGGWACPA